MRPGHRLLQTVPQTDLGRAPSHPSARSQCSLFFSPVSVVMMVVVSDCSFLHFELKADSQNALREALPFPLWAADLNKHGLKRVPPRFLAFPIVL